MQFFYDQQIRRFLNQFIRIFSNFSVEYGKDSEGNTILHRVPARYADSNRQASAVLQNNSENIMQAVPMIVVYIDGLNYDRERIQEPNFVEKRSIRERQYDTDTNQYLTTQKRAYTLERLMPVPYKLSLKVDLWTSNNEQKLQLLEQICTLFNPSLEIQSTDNYLDWTSLSFILLTNVNWTSRPIPVGTADSIDVSTLTFDLPIWLTTPAKLKKLGVIKKIVDSVYDSHGNLDDAILTESILTARRQYFTPLGYNLVMLNGQAQLVKPYGPVDLGDRAIDSPQTMGTPLNWQPLLSSLGEIKNGISEMHLRDEVTDALVVGTIAKHPSNPTILLFTVDQDTIPGNSLKAIDLVIDPTKLAPGAGLPAASLGQRYLLIKDMPANTDNDNDNQPEAWKSTEGLTTFGKENDIIEYDGTRWGVVFASQESTSVEYVTNTYTGIQYKWINNQWKKSWEGYYQEGFWDIVN